MAIRYTFNYSAQLTSFGQMSNVSLWIFAVCFRNLCLCVCVCLRCWHLRRYWPFRSKWFLIIFLWPHPQKRLKFHKNFVFNNKPISQCLILTTQYSIYTHTHHTHIYILFLSFYLSFFLIFTIELNTFSQTNNFKTQAYCHVCFFLFTVQWNS